mmetsp:Transcript_45527/g.88944  ORF Transcript_45527/g.88944 Transcript_45527/m.88944 type:complete len:255 (+) Transcript_45527:96-860(+)
MTPSSSKSTVAENIFAAKSDKDSSPISAPIPKVPPPFLPEAPDEHDPLEAASQNWYSIARVSIASFGGMLVGLSRNPHVRIGKSAAGSAGLHSSLLIWATVCGTFVGVVEGIVLLGPSRTMVKFYERQMTAGELPSPPETENEAAATHAVGIGVVADYALGGGAAGGIFSRVSSSSGIFSGAPRPVGGRKREKGGVLAAQIRRVRPITGIAMGVSVGLAAGVAIYALEYVERWAENAEKKDRVSATFRGGTETS